MSETLPLYLSAPPPPGLRRHVACLWRIDSGETPFEKCVLPDGCVDLLYVRKRGAAGQLVWVGTMRTAEVVAIDPFAMIVGVRFRPGAAAAFLGRPASEITAQDVAAIDIWPDAAYLDEHLATSNSSLAVEQVLLSTLERRLPQAGDLDSAMMRWATRMFEGHPDAPASTPHDLSDRQLRRRFAAVVGIGPKHFARIARLHRVIHLAAGPMAAGWAGLALDAGYHDQAHLIHDFVALTGSTPASFVRGTK